LKISDPEETKYLLPTLLTSPMWTAFTWEEGSNKEDVVAAV
jgi:hypothetical protein